MPRVNRYFLSGYIWHITQRCHRQSFLLKFQRDRKCWQSWLFEARKRYGLCILNYIVTSNHIHLLVLDRGKGEVNASMQLIASRTAQEYNNRKTRRGAFWEGRYNTTAVDSETYLARCMTYIDLNMVRAGVVEHPDAWADSGYREIQCPPQRYQCVDRERLAELMSLRCVSALAPTLAEQTEDALAYAQPERESIWTESLAVGSESFVLGVASKLGIKARNRPIKTIDGITTIQEPAGAYDAYFRGKMGCLSPFLP